MLEKPRMGLRFFIVLWNTFWFGRRQVTTPCFRSVSAFEYQVYQVPIFDIWRPIVFKHIWGIEMWHVTCNSTLPGSTKSCWVTEIQAAASRFCQGELVEVHDRLSELGLVNRKGGRNRVIALCEEQVGKSGMLLWKKFTEVFRNICTTKTDRGDKVMANLLRIHSANSEYRARCFCAPWLAWAWSKPFFYSCNFLHTI